MGVGKTTLITSICKNLGSDDLVSSPSFAIINEYSSENEVPIFHFDFYRIKKPAELLDIGFHEYCSMPAYCFIEWPENGESIIPDDFINVKMEERQGGRRYLSFQI
jgi:tRNA threonylcarbamoyladenosine biosynthesis protein TsaE